MFKESTTPEMRTKIQNMMLAAPEATAQGAMEAMFDSAIWIRDVLPMPIWDSMRRGRRPGIVRI
jgi:hypothetical protein